MEDTHTIRIEKLMQTSRVAFGTSGVRGPADAMTDMVCYAYTTAFLQHLRDSDGLERGTRIALGGDLRPSTGRIMRAAARAVSDFGCMPENCGMLPSPALAWYGFTERIPGIMVTGSHIPEDRNGIKYNRSCGEILKSDEAAIRARTVPVDRGAFDRQGMLAKAAKLADPTPKASELYVRRYTNFFPEGCLRGRRIGLYEHSCVGRGVIYEVLSTLGADVHRLGFSDRFIPVDTEAIRPEDVRLARQWAEEHRFDSIVSADGDADRPIVSDERGRWLRGDVAGILCARFLGADAVAAPVSCNSALEKCGFFGNVMRTRIGSPYVIEAMNGATASGARCVVGYEANGGFLINSTIRRGERCLAPLPTRDALILILSILLMSVRENKPVSGLLAGLPRRCTASDRLKKVPAEKSRSIIDAVSTGDFGRDRRLVEERFYDICGRVAALDSTDGVRITFENSEVIHLRPSGNAPEFRCYTEADSPERAAELSRRCLAVIEQWLGRI